MDAAAPPKRPIRSAETEARDAERKARLAKALRDNLRRRKGAPDGARPKTEDGRSDEG